MKIATKENTALSMVEAALEKAREYQDFNIFTSLNDEVALKKAAIIDAKIGKGEKVGRLAGVPYALKDNFLSPEGNTTASSHILEPFKSPLTATAVEKLEAEGAIMIGRTNLDSFAHGSSTENSSLCLVSFHWGPPGIPQVGVLRDMAKEPKPANLPEQGVSMQHQGDVPAVLSIRDLRPVSRGCCLSSQWKSEMSF